MGAKRNSQLPEKVVIKNRKSPNRKSYRRGTTEANLPKNLNFKGFPDVGANRPPMRD